MVWDRRESFKRDETGMSLIAADVREFSDKFDRTAPPVGLDMAGHDTFLLGPKTVMLDSFVVDLLHVDTSAQTFKLKLLVNMDWEDDGTIEEEYKAKRAMGRTFTTTVSNFRRSSNSSIGESSNASNGKSERSNQTHDGSVYKTGKYVLKPEFADDPLATTWTPEIVLVNAIADEDPIEAGSKFHGIQMLSGRPVISRSVLYQPECRCAFSFANFPFDETDLVVKFSSNKWNAEQVNFMWSHRLTSMGGANNNGMFATSKRFSGLRTDPSQRTVRRESSFLRKTVDASAIGGVGLSEFEIVKVRVHSDEKDVNSMQRYDNDEGAFSEAHLIISVRRDPYSYLLRVASVAELLMFLEVLSFLTDNADLSARFSISGTIFLAMVSLYGPMADNLPKVSVVTRVDKWHLFNFVLLFASNVENLVAFVLRDILNVNFLEYMEIFFACLYLYFVVKNLVWFITPLKERKEFDLFVIWFEDRLEMCEEKWEWFVSKISFWRKKEDDKKEDDKKEDDKKVGFQPAAVAPAIKAAVRFKSNLAKSLQAGVNSNRPRVVQTQKTE